MEEKKKLCNEDVGYCHCFRYFYIHKWKTESGTFLGFITTMNLQTDKSSNIDPKKAKQLNDKRNEN